MATKWTNTIFMVRKTGDYWDAFASQYPDVAKWVDAVTSQAGTSDADASVLQAAGAMLADLSGWADEAKAAMLNGRPIKFSRLCADLEAMRARWGVPSCGVTEIKEIGGVE